jgi:RNA polymerase sigma-70 factor, ECF subfamily
VRFARSPLGSARVCASAAPVPCGFDSSGSRRAGCSSLDAGPSGGDGVGQLAPAVAMIGPGFPGVLRAAAGGDEDAFGILWHDLQPRLLRYFRVVAPGAADDLASETWLGVIRGIGRFQGSEAAFRAWVFTIARHQVLDWWRRAARKPTQDLPVTGLAELMAPDDPAAAALEGASTRAALALIATLPAGQAEAVVLRVVAGLEVTQVAEIMDKRPNAVRVLTHRGLRRLAERLGADQGPRARRAV